MNLSSAIDRYMAEVIMPRQPRHATLTKTKGELALLVKRSEEMAGRKALYYQQHAGKQKRNFEQLARQAEKKMELAEDAAVSVELVRLKAKIADLEAKA